MIRLTHCIPTTASLLCFFLVELAVVSTAAARDELWVPRGPPSFPYDKKHDEVAKRIKQYVEDDVPLVDDNGRRYEWDDVTGDGSERNIHNMNRLVWAFELTDLRRRAGNKLRKYKATRAIVRAVQNAVHSYADIVDDVVEALLSAAGFRVGSDDSESKWSATLWRFFQRWIQRRIRGLFGRGIIRVEALNDDVLQSLRPWLQGLEPVLYKYSQVKWAIYEAWGKAGNGDSEIHRTAQCPTVEPRGLQAYRSDAEHELEADPNVRSLVRLVAQKGLDGRRIEELVSTFSRLLLDIVEGFQEHLLRTGEKDWRDRWLPRLHQQFDDQLRVRVPDDVIDADADPAEVNRLLEALRFKLNVFGRQYAYLLRTKQFVYREGHFPLPSE